MTQFSVLLSLYSKERPEFLNQALLSIFNQTLRADEVILVEDGPLTDELYAILNQYKETYTEFKTIRLTQNMGLGKALNEGLKHCTYDIVARMDTDDIAKPDRFEKQIRYLEQNIDIALLSGYIEEFYDNPQKIASMRIVPLEDNDIKQYLKKRNAFNHMAVMFKKSAVINSGGYQSVPFFEDYDLWIRIVQNGYRVGNISNVLVTARIGTDMIGRRHGFKYAIHELFFLKRQLKSGFINKYEYLKLVILRVPVRIMPKFILKFIYKFLRK